MQILFSRISGISLLLAVLGGLGASGQENGYVLVMPEHYIDNHTIKFTLGYCSAEHPEFVEIGSWELYDQVLQNVPRWLRINRETGEALFSTAEFRKNINRLYSLTIGEEIIWQKFDLSIGYIYGAWKSKSAGGYILDVAMDKDSRPTFITYTPGTPIDTALPPMDQFVVPAAGSFAVTKEFGGPYFSWTPGTDHLSFWLTYPGLVLPELPHSPPEELYNGREKSRWSLAGDLEQSFLLYSNPYYFETREGLKTRAGLYLAPKKEWLLLDLEGTECYPVFFGNWLCFEINEINPKSRPEEHYGYGCSPTGEYLFIDLRTGHSSVLKLEKPASILHVDDREVVVCENTTVSSIPIASIIDPECSPERIKLYQGGLAVFITYVVPVAHLPRVIVPEDLEPEAWDYRKGWGYQ